MGELMIWFHRGCLFIYEFTIIKFQSSEHYHLISKNFMTHYFKVYVDCVVCVLLDFFCLFGFVFSLCNVIHLHSLKKG